MPRMTLDVSECFQTGNSTRTPSIPKEQYESSGKFPIIDQSVAYIAGWTDVEEAVVSNHLPLIVFGDHTRILKFVDFPFACGADGTKLLCPNKNIFEPYFLYLALLSLKVPNKGYSRHYKYLRELKLSFPTDKGEQRAIARALRTVQEAKEARQRELGLERERKATLMQHLFTHGTRGEARKQTEIGQMPKSWQILKLGEVFETQLGKMLSQKAKVSDSPKPYMRNANVQWLRVSWDEVYKMDFTEKECEKFKLKYGDILVCEGGEVGRTAIWRDEISDCYFQKAIHRLRSRSNNIIAEFFLYWMERAFRYTNLYGVAGTQTTIAHLPQDKLQAMKIPVPALEEQNQIATVLISSDNKSQALQTEIDRLDELFKATLEELMTGKLSALNLIENE